jgi:hypothetical protein
MFEDKKTGECETDGEGEVMRVMTEPGRSKSRLVRRGG